MVLIVATACGGGGTNTGGQGAGSRTSVDVTLLPAGQTIEVVDPSHALDGLRVVVPEGAVLAPTRITIEHRAPLPSPALPAEQYGLTFAPEGTRFARPLEISVMPRWRASLTELTAYQTVDAAGNWAQVVGASWDAGTGRASATIEHFSGFVFLPRVPRLPLPPSGVYAFSILSSFLPSSLVFNPAEEAAIRETILAGPLQPFYGCAGGFAFTEVPWPASGNPTADIVIKKQDIPDVPQTSSFAWNDTFTQAFIAVRAVDLLTGDPILLYAGTGAVPADAYDLRTVIAHELSHFLSIPVARTELRPGRSVLRLPSKGRSSRAECDRQGGTRLQVPALQRTRGDDLRNARACRDQPRHHSDMVAHELRRFVHGNRRLVRQPAGERDVRHAVGGSRRHQALHPRVHRPHRNRFGQRQRGRDTGVVPAACWRVDRLRQCTAHLRWKLGRPKLQERSGLGFCHALPGSVRDQRASHVP
jgi:hypothetical protein